MTPVERAELRKYWAMVKRDNERFMRGGPITTHETCDLLQSAHESIPKLLDDVDRLERRLGEARAVARQLADAIDGGSAAPDATLKTALSFPIFWDEVAK